VVPGPANAGLKERLKRPLGLSPALCVRAEAETDLGDPAGECRLGEQPQRLPVAPTSRRSSPVLSTAGRSKEPAIHRCSLRP
jgi:hypothetical protein